MRVRYKLDPEPPWETISRFRRLRVVPERVRYRAFCVMELVLLGPAACSRPERPQVRVLIHRSHNKLVLVHRYARDCTGTHTSRWISRARGHTLNKSRLHRCVRNCELEGPLYKLNVVWATGHTLNWFDRTGRRQNSKTTHVRAKCRLSQRSHTKLVRPHRCETKN